jgi:hypothetical protein
MSITTYADLKTAIENWLDHTLFTARVPEFIVLAEAAANRRLRVRQMEATASLTLTNGLTGLPADYLAWREVLFLHADGVTRRVLDYVHPDYLQAVSPTVAAGIPTIWALEGSQLKVRPIDDTGTVLLRYYQTIPALSDAAPTNWLLTAHPDLYLFGALAEAEMFGVNDERAAAWKARRDEVYAEIEQLSNRSRGAGAVRVMGVTP